MMPNVADFRIGCRLMIVEAGLSGWLIVALLMVFVVAIWQKMDLDLG
jgi:hypothetical protein